MWIIHAGCQPSGLNSIFFAMQVRSACGVALGLNAFSLVLYSLLVLGVLSSDEWELDLIVLAIYLIFWGQTIVFVRVGIQAQAVLKLLHPDSARRPTS